jgi:hypothetical protein
MPKADQLPSDMSEFTFKEAVRVDSGVDFDADVRRLTTSIDKFRPNWRKWVWLAAGAGLCVMIGIIPIVLKVRLPVWKEESSEAVGVCAGPGNIWELDGSSLILKFAGSNREFYFCNPSPSALAEGERPGNRFFSGTKNELTYDGTAYVDGDRCKPDSSYHVHGDVFNQGTSVTLSGRRPLFVPGTCRKSSEIDTQFTLKLKQTRN